MKTYSLKNVSTFLFVLLAINLFGQKRLSDKPIIHEKIVVNSKKISSNISATTVMFLDDNRNLKTAIIQKNGLSYVNTILLLNDNCSIDDIGDLPILINSGNKSVITALIPLDRFEEVIANNCVKYLDVGVPFESTLDEARNLTNVDLVHSGSGLDSSYDGSGVVVGVIDEGFDFTHPTFRDTNGDSRISRVWIQGDNSGVNPNGYNYGSEYVGGAQILAKQSDMNDKSHGTHVAGIAAGSGIDGGNDSFQGMAYNSEIVLVSYNLPVNQTGPNTNTNVIDALNYLVNYANSVNKPLVINMSFGTHFGPHDGSSILDQEIDNLVDEGIIIVGAAGNEGARKIHVSSDFNLNESKFYFVENNESQMPFIDIWGNANTDFNVSFNIYNTITDTWIDVLPYINTNTSIIGQELLSDAIDNDQWSINYVVSNELNQKPRVTLNVDFAGDLSLNDGDIFVLEVNAENTSIDAWCTSSGFTSEFENYGYNNVVDGDSNITLREIGGTANEIITVGAYTSKNNYNDFFGNNHNANFFTAIGEIAPFSSLGSTVDGRMKPDITAPGNTIVSSVSSFDSNYMASSSSVVNGVTDGSQEWWYATLEGTSMAAPVVTGIIALWLQANPNLTPNDIKQLLDNTSIQDAFTGTSANNIWGRGKIDALSGMSLIEQTLSIDDHTQNSNLILYPNPTYGIINIRTTHVYSDFKLFNVLGQEFKNFEVKSTSQGYVLDVSNLSSDVYYLQVINNNVTEVLKVVKS
ncbi:S8 family serine peptidase [Psychroserpens algicola]|uniref:S8 family peptidase n=1 Tax=Psychroserpens algicola TaxID=1719034 RepID=A0ABT0H9C4_9FLAO|nr:S8 family serine peptidase [Psychroserpens algicola]MCK8480976.1 S8 family peptidase [Psychroserpens algicola]